MPVGTASRKDRLKLCMRFVEELKSSILETALINSLGRCYLSLPPCLQATPEGATRLFTLSNFPGPPSRLTIQGLSLQDVHFNQALHGFQGRYITNYNNLVMILYKYSRMCRC
jgi:hypothetical protein